MIPDSSQVKPYSRRGGRSRRDALLIGLLLLVNLVFVSVYLSGRAQKEQRKRRQERQWRLQAQTTLDAAQRRDAAYSAARRGDETAFRAAMAGLSDQDKRVLLAAFAQDGDLKTLRIWFQAGWPVGREALDDAMVRAATFQRPEVVRLLLKHHASPEATTQIYFTALTMACSHPASETAHILIQAGADVNRKMMWMTPTGPDSDWTPLMHAAQKGSPAIVRLLLRYHADVNSRSKNGVTALSLAREADRQAIANLLIEAGAQE